MTYLSSLIHFILVTNILCLRGADFIGSLQYTFGNRLVVTRFMTFINAFTLWAMYLPVVFLNSSFFDKTPRLLRNGEGIIKDLWFNRSMTVLSPLVQVIILTVYIIFVFGSGFDSAAVVAMGKFWGTVSCVLVIAQYLPQMITTCKLRSNGSLSLVLLAMQAPGGIVNAMFMWLGQGDNWSTWVSTLAAAIQQIILLSICLIFKWQKKHQAMKRPLFEQEGSSSEQVNMTDPLCVDPLKKTTMY